MTGRATEAREDRAIDQLCEILREAGETPVLVLSRPDREGVQGGCEAILQRGDRLWAVEHTCVYSIPSRPGFVERLKAMREQIIERVRDALPEEAVSIAFRIEEIPTGTSWSRLADWIAEMAIRAIPGLVPGTGRHVQDDAVPFSVLAYRWDQDKVGSGHCWVNPYAPPQELLVEDIRRALRAKGPKLLRERGAGKRTMLILEAEEVGFPNDFVRGFADAVQAEAADGFDEIVLAASAMSSISFWYLKLGESLIPVPAEYLRFVEAERRVHERAIGPHGGEEVLAVSQAMSRAHVVVDGCELVAEPNKDLPSEVYFTVRRYGGRGVRYVARFAGGTEVRIDPFPDPPHDFEGLHDAARRYLAMVGHPADLSARKRVAVQLRKVFVYEVSKHGWELMPGKGT